MWVGVRALSSTLFAREAITMIFTAVWALVFSLGKPWLGAAPGKALDGTRARGYRIWAAVSPSSASPRTRKVPLKTGKRGSGYEKANFFFFNFSLCRWTLLPWSDPVHAARIHPKTGKRALGRAKEIKSYGWNTEIKLTSCD